MMCMSNMHSEKDRGGLMKIIISNASDIPIYQQIKDQIKDAILRNELNEGELLPSIRSFANDLRVSVLTTRRVYDELESEGFVTSKAGKGTFVASQNLDLLRESKRHIVEVKMAEAWETAQSLGVTKEEFYSMMDLIVQEEE